MSTHSRCQIVRVDFSFLKSQPETRSARRQHGAQSPTRRANTARRCGRLVAPPTTFYTLRTPVDCTHTQVRGGTSGWWWAQRKRPVRRVGAQNARRRHWSFRSPKCQVPLGARFTPLGSNTRTRRRCFSESAMTKAMLFGALLYLKRSRY